MADGKDNKRQPKRSKKAPVGDSNPKDKQPAKKPVEPDIEEGNDTSPAYQDEPVFNVIYFHPTKYDDKECVPLTCQICGEEATHGFICEMNVDIEDTGEEYLESYVVCEQCFNVLAAPMMNIIFRNIDEMAQFDTNL